MCSASQDKKTWEERRLSINGAQNGLENRGNSPLTEKRGKCLFLLILSLREGLLPLLTPSLPDPFPSSSPWAQRKGFLLKYHLPAAHPHFFFFSLSLPRAGRWDQAFSCQKFGVAHRIFPRWASEKCHFTSKWPSLAKSQKAFFPQQGQKIILFKMVPIQTLIHIWDDGSALKGQGPVWFHTQGGKRFNFKVELKMENR